MNYSAKTRHNYYARSVTPFYRGKYQETKRNLPFIRKITKKTFMRIAKETSNLFYYIFL